jgi:hypothetical protein
MLTNQFKHAERFLQPSLGSECIPKELRERVEFRLKAGSKLLLVRTILVIIGFLGVGIFGYLSTIITAPGTGFLVRILQFLVPILAAPAILVITRSIRLLETDVYILAAEVVARCREGKGALPSDTPEEEHPAPRHRRRTDRRVPTVSGVLHPPR